MVNISHLKTYYIIIILTKRTMMEFEIMKRCIKCILPSNYPGITINEKGVCNFCTNYEEKKYPGDEALKKEIRSILKNYKDRNRDYDCIIGLSGGRDSSYLLYYFVKVLGLKVFTYSANHGFIPKQTINNIKKMTKILNVPLVMEEHDDLRKCLKHHIKSWMRKPNAAMIGLLCTGCRANVDFGLYKCAIQNKIPIVISGGTPFEAGSYKYNIMKKNPKSKKKNAFIFGYLSQIIKNPRWIINPISLGVQIKEYYYHYYRKGILRRTKEIQMVQPFLFVRWVEKEVVEKIETELNWKKNPDHASTWRGDCDIALIKLYLYKHLLGFSDKDDGLSCLIRDKQITREEALNRIEKESEIPEKIVEDILTKNGINFTELKRVLNNIQ